MLPFFHITHILRSVMKKQSHLLKIVRRILEDDPRPDYVIGAEVGMSPNTIRNIRKNKNIPNVLFVETLWEHLTGKKIEDAI